MGQRRNANKTSLSVSLTLSRFDDDGCGSGTMGMEHDWWRWQWHLRQMDIAYSDPAVRSSFVQRRDPEPTDRPVSRRPPDEVRTTEKTADRGRPAAYGARRPSAALRNVNKLHRDAADWMFSHR